MIKFLVSVLVDYVDFTIHISVVLHKLLIHPSLSFPPEFTTMSRVKTNMSLKNMHYYNMLTVHKLINGLNYYKCLNLLHNMCYRISLLSYIYIIQSICQCLALLQ